MPNNRPDPYAPCRCGSGKKYKFCCLAPDRRLKREVPPPSSAIERVGSQDVVFLDMETSENLNTEGMALLDAGRYAEAEPKFLAAIKAAPMVPAPRNNLALVTFIQGDIEKAIRIQEQAVRDCPVESLFGLASLAQLYLAAGRAAEAEALANDLARRQQRDPSALAKTCEIFARLRRHQAILDAAEASARLQDDLVCFYAGIAAANLGQYERAAAYLRRVDPRSPARDRAGKCARLIAAGKGPETIEGNWPYFTAGEILPPPVLSRSISAAEQSESLRTKLLDNAMLAEALGAMLNDGAGDPQTVLQCLGHVNHPRAVELLRKIAEGTFGSDELRLAASQELQRKGVWKDEEPHQIWLRGQWTPVVSRTFSVSPEAVSAELARELHPLYGEALLTARRGKWRKAEELWRRLIAAAPRFHPGYHNLAAALLPQGRNDEAEALMRKAMELDPKYVFAPCSLAVLCVHQGRIAEARDLLKSVFLQDVVHPDALSAYFAAQCEVALAEGDVEAAASCLDMARKNNPDSPHVKALRKHMAVPGFLADLKRMLRERFLTRAAKCRERVLARDAPLETCYGVYSREEIAGMATALDLDTGSRPRRSEQLQAVCAALRNADRMRRIVEELHPPERDALRAVVDAGGRMDYEAFTKTYGTDTDDAIPWGLRPPASLLGRLKCRGLLVEATVDRHPSVFVPAGIPL
jgi:tetratricopeptide (TPR) repeat protein